MTTAAATLATTPITTWRRFAREVRADGCGLLRRLGEFQQPVLVAGCQRSGTTVVARTLRRSEGMVDYPVGTDDELDAALILSGRVDYQAAGAHCFQTTYVNECYDEYRERDSDYKLIWVIRNPVSTVHSMLHNWGRFAFNELFAACGAGLLSEREARRYRRLGPLAVSRLRRACLAYNGKVRQVFELMETLDERRVRVVDYDRLIAGPDVVLPRIYEFIGFTYHGEYARSLHGKSLKKGKRLSQRNRMEIERACMPVYQRALALAI